MQIRSINPYSAYAGVSNKPKVAMKANSDADPISNLQIQFQILGI